MLPQRSCQEPGTQSRDGVALEGDCVFVIQVVALYSPSRCTGHSIQYTVRLNIHCQDYPQPREATLTLHCTSPAACYVLKLSITVHGPLYTVHRPAKYTLPGLSSAAGGDLNSSLHFSCCLLRAKTLHHGARATLYSTSSG
ncbi:hypothetical protein J6590_056661 [Homalodisca vitripennis]|nr:hypothetical protein J6590_056661 [Homalodisca vitripennis]